MRVGQIAVRYSKALFRSAKEQKALDAVRADMEILLQAVTDLPELAQLLESPIVDTGKKINALAEIFSSRFNELSLNFIRLATENNREEYLPGMARHFIHLYKEEKGIQVATISSATGVEKQSLEQIRLLVKAAFKSEIELEEEIKEELIGGFVLRVEDRQLDASVKGKLAHIKKALKE